MLELLLQHLAGLSDKYIPCRQKITDLIHSIHQHGLGVGRYWPVMVGLFNLSHAIFEQLFKSASGSMDFVARARFHIENLLNNMTLDDIAAEAFVSPCYLSRAFKRVPAADSPVTLPAEKSISPCLFCNTAI